MDLQEFINKYNGKLVTNQGNQCVALFRQFCTDVLRIGQPQPTFQGFSDRGARHFYENFNTDKILVDNFIKIENTPTFVPQKGDIAVWQITPSGNKYGHIAICTGKGNTSKFEVFEQNGVTNRNSVINSNQNYKKILGFLRPKNQNVLGLIYKIGQNVACSTRYPQPNSNINEVEHLSPYKSGTIAYIQEGSPNPYLVDFGDKQAWVNSGDIRKVN